MDRDAGGRRGAHQTRISIVVTPDLIRGPASTSESGMPDQVRHDEERGFRVPAYFAPLALRRSIGQLGICASDSAFASAAATPSSVSARSNAPAGGTALSGKTTDRTSV